MYPKDTQKETPAWGCLDGFPNGNGSGHAGLERIGGLDALVLEHPLESWDSKGHREIWLCLATESHVGALCSGTHPCEDHEHLPCCLYQAAPSLDSLLQPCPWLQTTCRLQTHCSALCPPGSNSPLCSLGKLFPSVVHHITPTAAACVTFFPPSSYNCPLDIYIALSCSPSGIIFLGYRN